MGATPVERSDARRHAGGAAARETGLRRVEHEAMIWGPHRTGDAPSVEGNVPARELGIRIGRLEPGAHDAITDVRGVRVGHATLIEGDGPLEVGRGPVRTGVTVVMPHDGDVWAEPVFAGCHRLNGNGELTGLEWIREAGLLGGPVAITNTHSVGVVRDALVAHAIAHRRKGGGLWSLPVVGETWDGLLNDIDGLHVRPEHVDAAIAGASAGAGRPGQRRRRDRHGLPRVQGRDRDGVAGPGCRGRRLDGRRPRPGELRRARPAAGRRRAGRARDPGRAHSIALRRRRAADEAHAAADGAGRGRAVEPGAGSIIVIVATDAPLLPHQCERLAQRATLGLARMGSTANHSSGDLDPRLRDRQPRAGHDRRAGRRRRRSPTTCGWSPTTA